MSEKQNPLGKVTDYPKRYAPDLLFPVPRSSCRDALAITQNLPFTGVDIWTAYEVCWLDMQGKPQVRIAEFQMDATSINLVESKSLKLYLFSLNEEKFDDDQAVKTLIEKDISECIQGEVRVDLWPLEAFPSTSGLPGDCIDDMDADCSSFERDRQLLKVESHAVKETMYSHLLKTNCPVTGQPDWASVWISYSGEQTLARESLLSYLVSFRHHQDYHENCIEKIFVDLMAVLEPKDLMVYGRFTRRGGLDINPYRSTGNFEIPKIRVNRQ